jgi:hypothetical protein
MRAWIEAGVSIAAGVALAAACSASGGERTLASGGTGQGGTGSPGAVGGGPGTGGTIGVGGAGVVIPDGAGGSGAEGDADCGGFFDEAKPSFQPADIIWGIDSSCSMIEESLAVQQNINAFSQQIVASGIDVHVVMLAGYPLCLGPICSPGVCVQPPLGTGTCPTNDTKLPAFFHHPVAIVNSNDGLDVFYNTFPDYRAHLRPGAAKHLVIVTDDNNTQGTYTSAAAFIPAYTARDAALLADPTTGEAIWKMSGVYAFTACGNAAAVGTVWKDMIDQTGGVHGDVCSCAAGQQAACTQAFQNVFNQLATKIVEGAQKLACQWTIPPPPAGQTFDPQKVNVEFTDRGSGTKETIFYADNESLCDPTLGGWYFNDNANPTQVVACPASCTKIEGVTDGGVAVGFGCERKVLPPPT